MCKECERNPCHPRCPNASDPPTMGYCDKCGEKLRQDRTYWIDNSGFIYCQEECAEDNNGIKEQEWSEDDTG